MENTLITFFKEDKEYKSPSTKEIIEMLTKIGINKHHFLIRKQVHIIINGTENLKLNILDTDSNIEKNIKEHINKGERSIILVF
ncbi:TPA: hypothetical protein JRX32_000401 [Elizabethkingia anophelis]|uniref:hypothetical protein n=1 Tax=Elizabethkingia anophelis TaxID=1117645 RepID=UPI001623E846|nr:hypothetical protein [Elizabethkingia anophelis]MCT4321544.1 hypothetical protein [Elizabethkingia anophelis]HAY3533815.1 hypothetical protein [Elizabethkingia anophelis]HAY3545931.1 hypothetical protein [Elizabethkingia anophelis]HAY3590758.1 hypothetical protein [Elizabethkingia anophelis]